jgi:RNA polymerase sigma factor (sigma-70 family)
MEASALHPTHRLAPSTRMLRLAGDDRLVALIRAGNDAAFEVVYDRYHRQLLSFCRHMLARADEAEDAVQQTFISAHADLRRSERPIALRAWLFTIARNRCLSILRARRETATLEEVEPETSGLAAEVQQREDLRTMLDDISRLPDDQRAALVLAELGDLDHGDIAAVVGCPKEKVKALVFQARSSLALSRQARDTPCEEIREQIATLRGGALRRTALRRHLRGCPGCREFRDEVRRQRSAMAVLLPVVPAAGLKNTVLTGAGLSASGAGSTAGAGAAGMGVAGAKLAVLKGVVAVAVVGAGAAGGVAAVEQIDSPSGTPRHGAPAASHAHGAAGSGVSSVAASAAAGSVWGRPPARSGRRRCALQPRRRSPERAYARPRPQAWARGHPARSQQDFDVIPCPGRRAGRRHRRRCAITRRLAGRAGPGRRHLAGRLLARVLSELECESERQGDPAARVPEPGHEPHVGRPGLRPELSGRGGRTGRDVRRSGPSGTCR